MSRFQMFARILMALLFVSMISLPASAGVFDSFAGTWRGTGKVFLKDGRRESMSCKIKSIIEVNGSRAYHIVKCKSDSKKIKVRINLIANNLNISGNWSASGSVEGEVWGIAKGKALNLQLGGHGITASLKLTANKCTQKMSLNGEIGKVRKITVQLKKSC